MFYKVSALVTSSERSETDFDTCYNVPVVLNRRYGTSLESYESSYY